MPTKQTMTISEVLETNIRILEGLRIPVREKEAINAVRCVIENEMVCLRALEQDAARLKAEQEARKAAAETVEGQPDPDEGEIRQFGEDRNG